MKNLSSVILASASPRRRMLLEQIGIHATIIPSSIEESSHAHAPATIVEELAMMKTKDVARLASPHALIIGADTIVALDDRILGKPTSTEDAFFMLSALSGKRHSVYTGVCLIQDEKILCFHEKTEVAVSALRKEEISAYITTGEPMDKAGAYGIQGAFAKHIHAIYGDYYNVVGLPLSRLYKELQGIGYSF